MIDIAANRGEWRDGAEGIEDFVITNVTGVQDAIAAGEGLHGFWAQQSVSIGNDADAHANSLRQRRRPRGCADRAGHAGCRR